MSESSHNVASCSSRGTKGLPTAVRAAVPLLTGRAVTVLRIGSDEGKLPDSGVMQYLARHGIAADLREEQKAGASVEERLEAVADELGATLIVMGAFGHSRLRETLFGGVTRYLLDAARVPLLLAH